MFPESLVTSSLTILFVSLSVFVLMLLFVFGVPWLAGLYDDPDQPNDPSYLDELQLTYAELYHSELVPLYGPLFTAGHYLPISKVAQTPEAYSTDATPTDTFSKIGIVWAETTEDYRYSDRLHPHTA